MQVSTAFRCRIIVYSIATALLLSPHPAWSAPVTINLQGVYSTAGGVDFIENDTIQYDTETGDFSATLTNEQASIGVIIKIIIITACLIFCSSKKEGAPDKSLLDLALGDLSETVISNLGDAGQAIFSSRLTQSNSEIVANIIGDLTNIDFSKLPSLTSIFDVEANARIDSTGPGRAAGDSGTDIIGLSIINSSTYTSIGDPGAQLGRRQFHTDLNAVNTGATNYQISGRTTANVVPEPSTAELVSMMLVALAVFRRRVNYRH